MAPVALHIGSTGINAVNGLYSLNDLHKASGGEERHQPSFFIRNDQTQALISEISKSGDSRNYISNSANLQNCEPLRVVRGKFGGTYACRELVIAYAAWVSPAFHLKVIRTFLAAAESRRLPPPRPPLLAAPEPAPEPAAAARIRHLEAELEKYVMGFELALKELKKKGWNPTCP
jgi:hypothetical protein